jgi:hypothetical protein
LKFPPGGAFAGEPWTNTVSLILERAAEVTLAIALMAVALRIPKQDIFRRMRTGAAPPPTSGASEGPPQGFAATGGPW